MARLDRDHDPTNFVDRFLELERRLEELERGIHRTAILAFCDSAQAVATGTPTTVAYNVVQYDQLSEFDDSAYSFTPKATGVYHIVASVLLDDTNNFTGAEYAKLTAEIDGSTEWSIAFKDQLDVAAATNGKIFLQGAITMPIEAGEVLTIEITHSSGSAEALYSTDDTWNYLAIHRVA